MPDIDIHKYAQKIESVKTLVKKSRTSERNKQLIIEFMRDCKTGWGGRKLTDARVNKLIGAIKILSELIEKEWEWVTKEDIKRILSIIDTDPEKGVWAQHDYRLILRKFIVWLRAEHGYPQGYPDREELIRILPIVKYPAEVGKIRINRPDKLKPAEEIPTQVFEEIWFSSDKKEWNGKEWIPTNPDADPQTSGYHITQEFSSFVTTETLLQILVRSPGEINNSVFEEKVIGVDWGDETRWVLVGRTAKNKFYVIDTGVFDDIDTMQHVEKLRLIISRENPKWIICDAGYGKTKNQILMRHYPGRVWSAFTNSGSNIPIWNTINEINGIPLPEDDWQYHVSVNHTAMCENTEAIINRRNLGIYYFPEQAARTDVFIFEISQADAEEVSTSAGKQ
ncbi:MAG: hypothetical protein KKG76_00255 [Euryarchaeota archaeon]|nr:hypothetical protein [Euryarchaeota archaeon]